MEYYRYIYKITCLKGGKKWENKYYIGQHSTKNMNDGYAGSGLKINKYYKEFGKIEGETYKKEILKDNITTETELNLLERCYIREHLGKENCLNISKGGDDYGRKNRKKPHTYKIKDDTTQQRINNKPKEKNNKLYLDYYENRIKLYTTAEEYIRTRLNI